MKHKKHEHDEASPARPAETKETTELTPPDNPGGARAATTTVRRPAELWPSPFTRRMFDWFDWPLTAVIDTDRTLRVEEYEDDGKLVVRAEMPGMDPDKDVHVQMTDHTLEIRAERTQEESRDEKGVRRSEFRYGSFYRMIELPPTAKESDVSAVYRDGILEVSVPLEVQLKPEPKAIPVGRK
jgi:HSP20 family molecular chaperone IbpA